MQMFTTIVSRNRYSHEDWLILHLAQADVEDAWVWHSGYAVLCMTQGGSDTCVLTRQSM
jgi:hypothetical protein